eukprot:Protomagalhaensia_wolfi_Nauph_80__732@NODE_1418_length_1539_cov_2271_686000_g307_i1_p1_GENE_NODE_1418_length_1539_cov_2271_686000_g307_i1NODE_1418_length_1539_cov_2271_686000_g307_i1_p1_ORF_typecomplete_len391_score109_20Integrin_beta/PF00362_18/1_3e26VWA/PF00092_28/0_0024VWA_2/PF13519_6/0_3_NODE_1418_length_1539_cov_2271_686000_g307_i11281300
MKCLFFLSAILIPSKCQEICYLPLDVVFLQDTTGSFDDDLPNVVAQIPDMINAVLADHPESQFGVAEFKDKPYFPWGEPDDFCYKLGEGKLSPDLADFEWAYSGLYASGGGDLPEAQFQALINTALDPAVGWRPLAAAGKSGDAENAGARLVIMSTDAQPHLPLDWMKLPEEDFPDVPRNLPVNSGTISTGDVNYECVHQDYPSAEQARSALKAKNIFLAILTPNEPEVVGAWQWFNEFLGQPDDFYQFISADSSDLIDGVLKAIASVTSYLCPTTTTVLPTEPPVPTLPPTEPPVPPTEVPVPPTEAPTEAPLPPTEAPTEAPIPTEAVTPAGTLEPLTTPGEAGPTTEHCVDPCPPHPEPCCYIFRPAVVIKINDAPQKVVVDYEKRI